MFLLFILALKSSCCHLNGKDGGRYFHSLSYQSNTPNSVFLVGNSIFLLLPQPLSKGYIVSCVDFVRLYLHTNPKRRVNFHCQYGQTMLQWDHNSPNAQLQFTF